MIFDQMVLQRVRQLRKRHRYAGVRKLQKMLSDPAYGLPVKIGRDRLLCLLRRNMMLSRVRKRYRKTTDSNHHFPVYPNLLKGSKISLPNQAWVCDITYIRLVRRKFVYLFLVTDLYSRKILGYALKDSLASEGAEEALLMAVRQARPGGGFIHHSDHGIQYCCKSYTALLKKHGASISMTGKDHCYDNAVAERVNGILKQEYGLGAELPSIGAAQRLADDGIRIYNSERLHLNLGYQTPEQKYALDIQNVNKSA